MQKVHVKLFEMLEMLKMVGFCLCVCFVVYLLSNRCWGK